MHIFGRLPEGAKLSEPDMLIATWFGAGLLPIGPGTWASAAALPFGWALMALGGWPALLIAAAIAFFAGLWAAGRFAARSGRADPPEVVIDEIAAQWLVLVAAPLTWEVYLIAFVIFRVFDTLKPWPASWADLEVDGAIGIMLDDLIAGVYAFATMLILLRTGII